MKAVRYYEIIRFAQKDLDVKDMSAPMNEEELLVYESIKRELKVWRAKGIEPMYELPVSYDDEEDMVDWDIYSKDFDEKVSKELKGE